MQEKSGKVHKSLTKLVRPRYNCIYVKGFDEDSRDDGNFQRAGDGVSPTKVQISEDHF